MPVNAAIRGRMHRIAMLVAAFKRNEGQSLEFLLDGIEEACVDARADLIEWEREQAIGQAGVAIRAEGQLSLDDYAG